MRFSVQLPSDKVEAASEFVSGEAIVEMARSAESAGFDACFVTEHPAPTGPWLRSGGHHALDPFVALSFAAAGTTRIRLQTHVLVIAYRNPFLTAKAIATLDVLSGGRLIVGIAAGYLEGEFQALGADFEHRNDVTDDTLRALRRIWSEEGLTLEGPGFRAEDVTALPRPLQRPHPPIFVGGNSRRAIRRAVELADGWLPFPTVERAAGRLRTAAIETLDDLRERLDYARAHAQAIGRKAPLEVGFVPFGLDMYREELPDLAAFRDQLAELEEIGVTWLTLALPSDSRAGWCARAARFGDEVLAKL